MHIYISGGSRISHWEGAPSHWGGANLRHGYFLAKMYVKMKELDPVGGAHTGSTPPRSANVYDSTFICKLSYKDKLGQTYIYICILSGRKKCDKYAIIFICKLCYKDKLGQTDKVIRC